MARRPYQTDVPDAEWRILQALMAKQKSDGRAWQTTPDSRSETQAATQLALTIHLSQRIDLYTLVYDCSHTTL